MPPADANPFYTGSLSVPKWGIDRVKGVFEALVSEEILKGSKTCFRLAELCEMLGVTMVLWGAMNYCIDMGLPSGSTRQK
jgi:hypothetical protein